ncbi:P-loop containing nucleoside triphosphate hydrolase protein [Phellopilus nigrolimitatus]|nr:P-loop containing nucleoside triphosphate hydrolase protein [Phellopilus nigrolimitatus]
MASSSSAVGIAGFDYAKKVQVLIKLITELRALGAQADIDLPRIAVIGNQSAGKSSLVEAISGVCHRLLSVKHHFRPKSCGDMHESSKVPDGVSPNVLTRVVQEEKFGPVLHDKSQLEDMLRRAQLAILNPSLAAEKFIDLDLSKVSAGQKPAGSTRQLQFSSNVVCLDLSSSEVTDLSFIDLPGIISNVSEGEDPKNIELVKSLVKEHISGNALILLTITMRDDIQNQSAALLAKAADPYGLRTIGVLTKPDTLQEGEHQPWLNVLAGRDHPLHHGYYVTKQPAVIELSEKLDHGDARKREREYFSTVTPWNAAESHIKTRMGVPNLTKELSRLLSQLIELTLPKLRADSKTNLDKCLRELQSLPPPPPENPIAELLRLVSFFTADLSNYVWGSPAYESLIQHCRPAYAKFMKDIIKTGPNFVAETRKVGSSTKRGKPANLHPIFTTPTKRPAPSSSRSDSDPPLSPGTQEIYESMTVNPKASSPPAFGAPQPATNSNIFASALKGPSLAAASSSFFGQKSSNTSLSGTGATLFGAAPAKSSNVAESTSTNNTFSFNPSNISNATNGSGFSKFGGGLFANGAQTMKNGSNTFGAGPSFSNAAKPASGNPSESNDKDETQQVEVGDDEFAQVRPKRAPMYLNEVREFIESSLTRQLPLTVPHEAKARLIEQCFEEWPALSEKCFDVVHTAFKDCLEGLVCKNFQRNIVEKELEKAKERTIERLLWMIELENPPFTQNEHYFVDYKEKYLAQYREQRGGKSAQPDATVVNEALAKLTELGFSGVTALDLQKLHGPDKYEQELILMAEVRAYFRVAYKRIIDNIPRVIDHEFLHKTRKSMQAALIKELGMGEHNSAQRAAAYLSEEPRYLVRREELLQMKDRLEGVLEKLYKFTI